MKATVGVTLLALGLPGLAAAATWEVDPSHSAVSFKVRHLAVTDVRGELGAVSGTLQYDEKDPAKTKVNLTVDMKGIDTRDEKRDAHLQSPDFFDVAKHPTATFVAKKVKKTDKGLEVTGDLTIRGKTKSITFPAELSKEMKDPWGNTKRGASATFTVNRQDFGVSWNKTLDAGGLLVGDEVTVYVDLELNKKK